MIQNYKQFWKLVISQTLLCCFLKASTVAAPSVKTDISDHMATVLMMSFGMASK